MNALFQQGISLTEGGASRGEKGYFVKDDDSFCVSMIVAFSHKRVYGCMATKLSISASFVKYFCQSIIKLRSSLFPDDGDFPILVGDNSQ